MATICFRTLVALCADRISMATFTWRWAGQATGSSTVLHGLARFHLFFSVSHMHGSCRFALGTLCVITVVLLAPLLFLVRLSKSQAHLSRSALAATLTLRNAHIPFSNWLGR